MLNLIDGPWFCRRDMNDILWKFEKQGGCDDFHTRPRFLHEFMMNMELLDLGFCGLKFTWRGTRNNDLVQERVNRGVVNESWQTRWPSTTVTHGIVRGSDHCPIIVNSDPSREKRKKIFRFEVFWAKDEGCRELVERSWCRRGGGSDEDKVERWLRHQAACKGTLMNWNRSRFKCAQEEIDVLMSRLGHLQEDWQSNVEEIRIQYYLVSIRSS